MAMCSLRVMRGFVATDAENAVARIITAESAIFVVVNMVISPVRVALLIPRPIAHQPACGRASYRERQTRRRSSRTQMETGKSLGLFPAVDDHRLIPDRI